VVQSIPEAERGEKAAPSRYRAPRIAIVIPAFNEERNIEQVLIEVNKLRAHRPRWDILPIVVNDGSTDQTGRILERVSRKYRARAIQLPLNLGIGRAVQAGFRLAVHWGADVTLQLDGDGQHPAEQIPALAAPILAGMSDVVVGSRYIHGAGGNVSSTLRQGGTLIFSKLLRFLVGVRVNDATSGFRAFNHDAADFIARYYPDDYPEVEAYVPLARQDFQIREVAVKMRARAHGRSSITFLQSFYYMLKVAFAATIGLIRPLPPRRHLPQPLEARDGR
jgi:glycosyltransferase involved in cell wall biosynthesis